MLNFILKTFFNVKQKNEQHLTISSCEIENRILYIKKENTRIKTSRVSKYFVDNLGLNMKERGVI